jgi:lipoprotein-anchoring transpeptidase ErfK/SrfK
MRKRILSIGVFAIVLVIAFFLAGKSNNTNDNFCANSISCIKNLAGIYDKSNTNAVFEGKNIFVPYEIVNAPIASNVLGDSTANKRIEVDLTNQRLYAYEGGRKVYDFLVSTGKWGRTPTGTFDIWIKLRYTKMEGGNKDWGTYYYLPNVPYVMFFYNDQIPKMRGFGIHGTYWHSNFGHPMSHGCINMKTEEVEQLYYWANPPSTKNTTYASADNPGTKIIIYGEAPNE